MQELEILIEICFGHIGIIVVFNAELIATKRSFEISTSCEFVSPKKYRCLEFRL